MTTLIDLLTRRSKFQPEHVTYRFMAAGEEVTVALTNRELVERSQAVAACLQALQASGERVLLLLPPGLDYIVAFLGCLCAGEIAVPVYPPRRNRLLSRLQAIVSDAQPSVVLTTSSLLNSLKSEQGSELGLAQCTWLAVDTIGRELAAQWRSPTLTADSLAFLQYTSGSTASPKGVMVSHHNLLHNLGLIQQNFAVAPGDLTVSWLPPYHDMGLIGGILEPLYAGSSVVLMPPVAFLQRPVRWLQAIAQFRAAISGGPNFAYEYCLQRITDEERAALDLSSWELAFNGAETVRADTLARFAKTFAPCGFQASAFYPCYGMAEATLFVTGGRRQTPPVCKTMQAVPLTQHQIVEAPVETVGCQTLVGCGQVPPSQTVAIVHPDTRQRCRPHEVGEIWVAGSSVAQGYWQQPEATTAAFQATVAENSEELFLRTGDLGFLAENELFVTGRLKDLVIIRGRNHYPQDLERTAEQAHPGLRASGGAAFTISTETEERLMIVHEVERRAVRGLDDSVVVEIAQAIRQAIASEHDLQVYGVYLLKPGGLPKTSSGKIQRRACQQGIVNNSLEVVGSWCETANLLASEPPAASKLSLSHTAQTIRDWLVSRIAQQIGAAPCQIDPQSSFSDYGIDSVTAVSLSGELEKWLERQLSPTLIYDYPTICQLAEYLAYGQAETVAPQGLSRAPLEGVAIVGLGCRFPGAESPKAFWNLLRDGQSAIIAAPSDRWISDESAPRHWGGFLAAIDQFDASFFGIAPREAEKIDPQQRWLLEVAWEALEQAGQSPDQLAGSQTGVFVGISSSDYGRRLASDLDHVDAYTGTGNALSIAANRLSYLLNLRGPSLAVDTACSSSLVAIHLACQSLRQGECDLALAAGVNALLSPELTLAFTQAQMMAADGRCKTFDAAADGYGRGEGCGVVVLKRLSEAQAAGDRILAVIRGSAVNQDGRSNGLTAPNGPAQQTVIRQALAKADVAPAQIQYVEAHGTGTPLGDPIEVEALQAVLSTGRSPEAQCYLGSVKTNLGHLEAAAGIAGLIKVVLALQHQEIPPHLNLNQLNPYITLDQTPFAIATKLQRWTADLPFRLAGVSSFGFGGTNAHVVLEAADRADSHTQHQPKQARPWQLLTLSAKTVPALQELTQRYQRYLTAASSSLADICFTANTGRSHFAHRLAITTASREQLQAQLAQMVDHQPAAGVVALAEPAVAPPKVAFLFTGQGSQFAQMGRQLYETQPVFRQTLERCAAILDSELDDSLLRVLYPPAGTADERIHQTRYAQPALFALEYALAQLWQSWGIQPKVVMGHSVGEYVAACISGVFDLTTGLKLIAARGRLMQALPSGGRMAVVFASSAEVMAAISPDCETVSLAAINGPKSVVISGAGPEIEHLLEHFAAQGVQTRHLSVSHAFHSPLMAPMLAEFEQVARSMRFVTPQIPLITNLTGQLWPADVVPGADHWLAHVSAPVQFQAGMETLQQQDCRAFLEIGPSQTLLKMGRYCCSDDSRYLWLPSLQPGEADWRSLLESLATLYVQGADIDWPGFEQGYRQRRVELPTYPFQRQRYWISHQPSHSPSGLSKVAAAPPEIAQRADVHPLLGQPLMSSAHRPGEHLWWSLLDAERLPYLGEHRLWGSAVLFMGAYVEMALAAAKAALGAAQTYRLSDLQLHTPLFLPEGARRSMQVVLAEQPEGSSLFQVYSQAASFPATLQSWTLHASAHVHLA